MKSFLKIFLFTGFALCLGGSTHAQMKDSAHTDIIKENEHGYFSQIFGFELPGLFNSELYDTIYNWLGTPYRYAGKTLKGIDCSGFVNSVYQNVYGFLSGGNSRDLFKVSKKIKRDELQEGDLVFFRTRKKQISHVGIYLGKNKFVHSSRSNGVIISDLSDPYYKKYFAGAGRML